MSLIDKTLIDLFNLADYHTKISAIIEANKNNLGSLIIELSTLLGNKQDSLQSGTNIKTINGQSLLGSGDITIESSSNENCVHTYPNEYDFGLDMSLLFELPIRYEAIENLSYTQWQNDTENYVKYLIYNWNTLCNFVKNVKDNTIITYSFDAFGGDKQLLFVDIDAIDETTDEKTISIISLSTYSFNPLTSYISIKNASSVTNNDYRNCLLSFRVASDAPLAASTMYVHTTIAEYDQAIKQYIDETINGLVTREFGD